MNNTPLNRQTAARALSDVFTPNELNLSMTDILRVTAQHFEVEARDLKSKGRRHELVFPRQIAMYLIRELTPHSFPEIGQFFSGRDHSTVMYAVQKVADQVEEEPELSQKVREIKEQLI